MTREIYLKKLEEMVENTVYSKSSGKNGRIFETLIRGANKKYDTMVARQGRCDCIIKLNGKEYRSEEKSGCGELKVLDFDGTVITDILETEMVIYTMECEPMVIYAKAKEMHLDILATFEYMMKNDLLKYPVYAVKPETFMNLLDEVGLVREKTSHSMAKRPPQEQFYDRISIQSFKNSKKKMVAFAEALETYGMKVTEFK